VKRYGNLYEKIYDFENIHQAYLMARKKKRYNPEVLEFTTNLEENLIQIQNELIKKTYEVGEYREYFIYDPKKRLIMALPFKDRVVQWSVYLQINSLFDKTLIYNTYACRVGKGTHNAADKLYNWVKLVDRKPQQWYYLKLDISKYFYRVDHDIMTNIHKQKIKDPNVIWLIEKFSRNPNVPFGLPLGVEPDKCPRDKRLFDKGMPVGDLISQPKANINLNLLDQYCVHELKLHYYIRYMDDIIILYPDKNYLHIIKNDIEFFLNTELKLHLNNKTCIRPIDDGIDFVGQKIWPTHRKLKKKTVLKMKRRLKYLLEAYIRDEITFDEFNASIQSYMGLMKHCDSYNLQNKILLELPVNELLINST